MTTRRVTVKKDQAGKLFIKFRVFKGHYLIVRPGVPDCFGGKGADFKVGDKVSVTYWNMNMGFFMVKMVGDPHQHCIWQGPRWVVEKFSGEWIGEQLKTA